MKKVHLPERPEWRTKAEAVGFGFHEMYGEPYWLDDTAFSFSYEEAEVIEQVSEELHEMCIDMVGDIVASEEKLDRLAIPEALRDIVRDSWQRGDRHFYGRFDLAYDGVNPIKMLEYNADTPTSVFETAFFQHNWMTDQVALGVLPEGTDQFNSLQEAMVEAFGHFSKDRIFHFAVATDNEEDRGTVVYMMDCAIHAGHKTELIDIRDIGVDAQGRFTDMQDRTIDRCFKLYPWEHMLREKFADHLRTSAHVFVEPAWKAVLSNKGMLPLLWDRHKGHPNLLPAFYADDAQAAGLTSYVRKPLFSREGENVTIIKDGELLEAADGEYGAEGFIIQGYAPLYADDEGYSVIGSWIVGDRACGMCIRQDASRITANLSRFIPHYIEA